MPSLLRDKRVGAGNERKTLGASRHSPGLESDAPCQDDEELFPCLRGMPVHHLARTQHDDAGPQRLGLSGADASGTPQAASPEGRPHRSGGCTMTWAR